MKELLKRTSATKLDIIIFIIIAFLGIINLPLPFGDDQSLFVTGAQLMADGKILYKDFWDYKPPGIYYFFFLAGSLFSFTEVGIHTFELILWLLFTLIMFKAFKSLKIFENRFIVSLAPLFTAGLIYSLTGIYNLTQVESIINIFLFITLWLSIESIKSEKKRFLLLFLSGLTGGIVLTFKFIFLPLVASFWLTVFIKLYLKDKEKFQIIFKKYLIPVASGFLIPIVLLFIYYLKMNLLEVVYETFFIYPPRLVTEIPTDGISKLYKLFLSYIDNFYPVLAFSLFGIVISIWHRRNLFLINLFIWLILGIIIIIATRTSWWYYHTQLLTVPVGIFFLIAIDFLYSGIKQYKFVDSAGVKIMFVIILMVFFQPALLKTFGKTKYFVKYLTSSTVEAKKVIAGFDSSENDYPFVYRNIDILDEYKNIPGDIYVASVASFYYLSGRSQAVPINGWVLVLLLPELWDKLNQQIMNNEPAFIFMDTGHSIFIPDVSPETVKLIKEHYSILRKNKDGIWFIKNGLIPDSNNSMGSN